MWVMGKIFYNIRRLVLAVLADYSNMARARRWNSRNIHGPTGSYARGRGVEGVVREEPERKWKWKKETIGTGGTVGSTVVNK